MLAAVHIGLPKTGTSSMQLFFYQNRRLLLERQGCLYPASVVWFTLLGPSHNLLTMLPYAQNTPRLREELRRAAPQRLILSAEMLSLKLTEPALIRDFTLWLQELGVTRLQVVAYVRDIASHLASECSQALRDGYKLAYERLHPRDNPRAQSLFNVRAILEPWLEVCGRENIRVRLFEPQSFAGGDLLHDAAEALDLRWDEDFIIPPRQNERLNLLEMEMLRSLNQLAPYAIYARNTLKASLWQCLSRHTSALQGAALRFAPPRATLEAYLDYFAESEEWVRREFFPERPYLFPRPDLSAYQENPILRDPQPEHWQALARTLIDLGQENARLRAELVQLQPRLQEGDGSQDGS